MSTRLRALLVLTATALVLALVSPVWAQPASPPATGASEPGASEPANEPAASEPAGTESPTSDAPDPGIEDEQTGKVRLPLDLSDKQDLLGAVLIAGIAAAAAIALLGTVKQLRGDRPQADGTWRPR